MHIILPKLCKYFKSLLRNVKQFDLALDSTPIRAADFLLEIKDAEYNNVFCGLCTMFCKFAQIGVLSQIKFNCFAFLDTLSKYLQSLGKILCTDLPCLKFYTIYQYNVKILYEIIEIKLCSK